MLYTKILSCILIFPKVPPDPLPPPILYEYKIANFPKTLDHIPNILIDCTNILIYSQTTQLWQRDNALDSVRSSVCPLHVPSCNNRKFGAKKSLSLKCLSNESHYQSKVFVSVSVINGHITWIHSTVTSTKLQCLCLIFY